MNPHLTSQLTRIRNQKNSPIESQKKIAILLCAIDESIPEQNVLAYFGATMTFLSTLLQSSPIDTERLAAVTYLLAILLPHVNSQILKLKFEMVSQVISTAVDIPNNDAPLLRSLLECIQPLIIAQDATTLTSNPLAKKLFQTLLFYTIDARPKVRKLSHSIIQRILTSPPPPALYHPLNLATVDFIQAYFKEFVKTQVKTPEQESLIFHMLVFFRTVAPVLTSNGVSEKCKGRIRECTNLLLVVVEKAGKGYIIQNVFTTLGVVISPTFEIDGSVVGGEETTNLDIQYLDYLLNSVSELQPNLNDVVAYETWLNLIAAIFSQLARKLQKVSEFDENYGVFVKYASTTFPGLVLSAFQKLFVKVFGNSVGHEICRAATLLFEVVVNSISDEMIEAALKTQNEMNGVLEVLKHTFTPRYSSSQPYTLLIISTVITRLLKYSSATVELLRPVIEQLVVIRDGVNFDKEYPQKLHLEDCFVKLCSGLGLSGFLGVVGLNLSGEGVKRPYLIPVLGRAINEEYVTKRFFGKHTFGVCSEYIVPQTAVFVGRWRNGSGVEVKLYETLAGQMWGLVPGIFACLPRDVENFDKVAVEFGKVLQEDEVMFDEMKVGVCDAMVYLIEGWLAAKDNVEVEEENQKIAKKGLEAVKKYGTRFLNALCNCFTKVPEVEESKVQALQTKLESDRAKFGNAIKSFLKIIDEQTILSYCSKLLKMLIQSQSSQTLASKLQTHALLDLLSLLIPHLSSHLTPLTTIYNYLTSLLPSEDSSTQKKAYRNLQLILTTSPHHTTITQLSTLCTTLLNPEIVSRNTAKRQRIQLIIKLLEMFPTGVKGERVESWKVLDAFIPRVLVEVFVCVKESNEKTRGSGFECVVEMAKKCVECSDVQMEVQRHGNGGEDEGMEVEVDGIARFFEMVKAGLESDSVQMKSAAVACLGRLVFEFKDEMDEELCNNVVNTILLLPPSTNRELIKSILGVIKVITVTLSPKSLSDYAPQIIPQIIQHSKQNKSQFRVKVRHILERIVKKVGFEKVEECVPKEDEKLIANIRKRRDRKIRKQRELKDAAAAAAADEDDEYEDGGVHEKVVAAKQKAYNDAVYGSESEFESDDENVEMEYFESNRGGKVEKDQVIKESDQVLDFLGVDMVSSVSSVPVKLKKRSAGAGIGTKDGKLVFEEAKASKKGDDGDGGLMNETDWYKESLTGESAFTRNPDGSIRFLKGKKRGADADADDTNVETEKKKVVKKNLLDDVAVQRQLGRQYKAKKAKGDVKKAGMPDPFAYIPLNPKAVGGKRKATKLATNFKTIVGAARFGDRTKIRMTGASGSKIRKGNKSHK